MWRVPLESCCAILPSVTTSRVPSQLLCLCVLFRYTRSACTNAVRLAPLGLRGTCAGKRQRRIPHVSFHGRAMYVICLCPCLCPCARGARLRRAERIIACAHACARGVRCRATRSGGDVALAAQAMAHGRAGARARAAARRAAAANPHRQPRQVLSFLATRTPAAARRAPPNELLT